MATMPLGELVWKVTGDTSGLKKSLKDSDKAIDKTGKKLRDVSGRLRDAKGRFIGVGAQAEKTGGSFKKFAKIAGGALVAIGLTKFIKSTAKAASDAEEVGNKFGVVFSGVTDKANALSADLAKNYGLSQTASKGLIADTGDLLTGFGFTQEKALELSSQVAALGTDLASFTNFSGGAEGAVAALSKGLLGEREALKSLGIAIGEADLKAYIESQGKSFEAATRQEKAIATLTIAISQSKNAVGDFARSQDSLANVQRRVSARFNDIQVAAGEKLLPAMSKLGIAFLNATEDGGFLAVGIDAIITVATTAIEIITNLINTISDLSDEETQIKVGTDETRIGSIRVAQLKTLEGQQNRLNALENNSMSTKEQILAQEELIAETKRKIASTEDELAESIKESNKELEKAGLIRTEEGKATEKNSDLQDQLNKRKKEGVDLTKKAAETAEEAAAREEKALADLNSKVQFIGSTVASVLGSIASIQASATNAMLANLDAAEERALEAAGVAEESAIERAEKDLEAAREQGDEETIIEKENALKRAKIQEDFAKQRKKLEYEGALTAWEFQVALAVSQLPVAVLNAYSAGAKFNPLVAGIYAGAALLAGGLQIAAVNAAKPQPPKFATGGIVPGSSFSGDNVSAQLNSGEMVLNDQQQGRLFNIANSGGGGGGNITIYLGDEQIYKSLFQASENGELIIDARAVVE